LADDQVSKGGVFIDTKTGQVVESQPEEGIQLVAPGGVIDDNARALIETAKATAAGEDSGADKTVTTRTGSRRS
jgi:hypothetical protein